jgi:hypothetical protein
MRTNPFIIRDNLMMRRFLTTSLTLKLLLLILYNETEETLSMGVSLCHFLMVFRCFFLCVIFP